LVQVVVQRNESIDRALKRFKKLLESSGILGEARRHLRYEKPSDRRRRKRALSVRRRTAAAKLTAGV
jgi:small subunit ribosomal protein S21